MLSKSFFGYTRPAFRYELLSTKLPQPVEVAVPKTATLLLPGETGAVKSETLKVGARVKTGQCLTLDHLPGQSVISSITGTISAIQAQTGNYGQKFTAITVVQDGAEELDDGSAHSDRPAHGPRRNQGAVERPKKPLRRCDRRRCARRLRPHP